MVETTSQRETVAAIAELRKEFIRRGWYKKATARIVFELAIHVALTFGGIAIFIACDNLALRILGILIATYGGMGVGTNTHTSTHYGTSEKRWVNELLSYFGYTAFLGVSATYWWHKHVALHHPSPNVIGVDVDADLTPWFAITAEEVEASRGLGRFYYKNLQFWAFPFMLAFTCVNMQFASWMFLGQKLVSSKQRKASHWIDLACLVAHFAFWIGIPLFFWPALYVVGFYALRVVLLGYMMYFILAPGHLPAEAIRTKEEAPGEVNYFALQTTGTLSFRTGFLGRFLCSGLEYQVEHHLFPNLSHNHYPKVSREVQAFCKEHGFPYRSLSWGVALWKSWDVLRSPQPVHSHVDIPGLTDAD